VKLCLGGGHEVAHSRDDPYPQGSSVVTFGELRDIHTFIKYGIIDKARRNEPTVETIFITVKPSVDK
jgi:hypothetical protein